MNTKSLLTRIGVPVLSLAMLGGLGATLATSASAAVKPVTVTANTHLNQHPDTTSLLPGYPVAGQDATVSSPNGPVWAYDNVTEKFTVVPAGTNLYTVTIDFVGSFHGFADPTTAAALNSDGSVKGTIQYTVSSLNAPDPANLPGQTSGDATLSDNINALFGGSATSQVATVVGWGPYLFSYQNGDYTQYQPATGPYVQNGDVAGH
jgi:hypothetical protein